MLNSKTTVRSNKQKKRVKILNDYALMMDSRAMRLSGTGNSFGDQLQPSMIFSAPQQQKRKVQRNRPQVVKWATSNTVMSKASESKAGTAESNKLRDSEKTGTDRRSIDSLRKLQQKMTVAIGASQAFTPWSDSTSLNPEVNDDLVML